MKTKALDAVKLKRNLQKLAEDKLASMSLEEQIEFLRKKFGKPTGQRLSPARHRNKTPD